MDVDNENTGDRAKLLAELKQEYGTARNAQSKHGHAVARLEDYSNALRRLLKDHAWLPLGSEEEASDDAD